MVDAIAQISIDKPFEEVDNYPINPDYAPTWYVNLQLAEWKTQPPIQQGTLVKLPAKFLENYIEYTYEFIEVIPSKKLVMQPSGYLFPMQTTYTSKIISDTQTKMTLQYAGTPTGFSILFSPFMSLMMRKANNKDLIKFKSLLVRENG